jgi:hypothetical protein
MSGDVERVAAVLTEHTPRHGIRDGRLHCWCGWTGEHGEGMSNHLAQVLLAPGGVVAGMVAEVERKSFKAGRHRQLQASADAWAYDYAEAMGQGADEVRARVEALADEWESRAANARSCAEARLGLSDAGGLRAHADLMQRRAEELRAMLAAEPTKSGTARRSDGLEGSGAGGSTFGDESGAESDKGDEA